MDKMIPPESFDVMILDGDYIVYKAGFAVEKHNKEMDIIEVEELQKAIFNVMSMVKKSVNRVQAKETITFITPSGDKTNFRFNIFTDYKANRKLVRRPVYYVQLREYIVKAYNAIMHIGQEADDSCSIAHLKAIQDGKTSVLCSVDKDFDNVPGWHYNPTTDRLYYVDRTQALRNKYLQILAGDTSDGIPRIQKGWRKKKVETALKKALTEKEMYEIILTEIEDLVKDNKEIIWIGNKDLHDEIISRGRLVHLRAFEEELWEPTLTP